LHIASRHLLPKQLEEHGLTSHVMQLPLESIKTLSKFVVYMLEKLRAYRIQEESRYIAMFVGVMVALLQMKVFWGVTSCHSARSYCHFKGSYSLHRLCFAVKMKAP
jgi:hypothetical protein